MLKLTFSPLSVRQEPDIYQGLILHQNERAVLLVELSGPDSLTLGTNIVTSFQELTDLGAESVYQWLGHQSEVINESEARNEFGVGTESEEAAVEVSPAEVSCQVTLITLNPEEKCVVVSLGMDVMLERSHQLSTIIRGDSDLQIREGPCHSGDIYILPFGSERIQVACTEIRKTSPSPLLPLVTATQKLLTSAREQLQRLFSSLWSVFRSHVVQGFQELFSRDVYVRRRSSKQLARIILPILICLSVATFVFITARLSQDKNRQEALRDLPPYAQQLESIKTNAETFPGENTKKVEELQQTLATLRKDHSQNSIYVASVDTLLDSSVKVLNTLRQSQVENVPFIDLNTFSTGFLASRMCLTDTRVVLVDTSRHDVLILGRGPQMTKQALFHLDGVYEVACSANRVVVETLDSFFQLSTDGLKLELLGKKEAKYPQISQLRVFGGAIYGYDVDKKQIIRWPISTTNSVTESREWLKSSLTGELGQVSGLAVDGQVWLATSTGHLSLFANGASLPLVIKGLEVPLTSTLGLYTSDNDKLVYVLESQQKRVVILSKTGEFVKELHSSYFASAAAIQADELQKKLFVLSGSLLFQVDL